ncbi:MAG: caspase family protein [Hyphomicrobiaceae bacterium]
MCLRRLIPWLLGCALLWIYPHQSARASSDRLALVIGNGAYSNATPLRNAPNDGRLMAARLKEIGFDVIVGIDVSKTEFRKRLRTFARKLPQAKTALFFYAGHGLQVSGDNYVVPVDASVEVAADLDWETIKMRTIIQQMEAPDRTTIVILDACRDNPLTRRLSRMMGASRSSAVGRGLARMVAGAGSFIAFATAPDQTATDGDRDNSPFTRSLAKHIATPGADIAQLFRRVRVDVETATGGEQVPWSNSSLRRDFAFVPAAPGKPAVSEDTVAKQSAIARTTPKQAFEIAREIGSCEAYGALIDTHGGTFYGNLAKRWHDANCKTAQTDTAALSGEVEVLRKATATPHLIRDIQTRLAKSQCYRGAVDGVWGPGSRNALRRFVAAVPGTHKLSGKPDAAALKFVDTHGKIACKTASVRKAPSGAVRKKPAAKPVTTTKKQASSKRRPAKKKSCTSFAVCVNRCIKYDPPGGPGQCPKLCSQGRFGSVC